MTDLEMTKICAEAMGYTVLPEPSGKERESVLVRETVASDPHPDVYDPLHDDAQAMALVKRFRADIFECRDSRWRVTIEPPRGTLVEAWNADLNRAIVECVAKVQARK